MNIRMATEADFDALLQLTNTAFDVERFFKDEDRLDASKVRSYFNKGNFLVLEEDGKLIASVYVELNGDRAYLGLLAVDPTQQKRGLGRRISAPLKNSLEKWVRASWTSPSSICEPSCRPSTKSSATAPQAPHRSPPTRCPSRSPATSSA